LGWQERELLDFIFIRAGLGAEDGGLWFISGG